MCIYYFNPRRDHTIIYSDSVKAVLLAAIDRLAADPETYANKLGKDFTSNRKLGFKRLTLMVPYHGRGMHQGGNLQVF